MMMKERQAWCYLQVKLCDPCLSALSVPHWPKKRYINTLPFLSLILTQNSCTKRSQVYRNNDTIKTRRSVAVARWAEGRESVVQVRDNRRQLSTETEDCRQTRLLPFHQRECSDRREPTHTRDVSLCQLCQHKLYHTTSVSCHN